MYKYIFGQIFHTVPSRSKLNKAYVRTYVRNIFLFAFVRIESCVDFYKNKTYKPTLKQKNIHF